MNRTRELPRLIEPSPDISLTSYVEKLAAMYKVSLVVMLNYLGILTEERYAKLNGYGIVLTPSLIANVAKATRLNEARVRKMLLRHYDGICLDLSSVDDFSTGLRERSVSEWAYFSGSHICPGCLAESAGAWQLKWKFPWSFACVKHKCYLVEKCPACSRRLGTGRTDRSLSPVFVNLVPSPGHCGNPQKFGLANIGKGAVPCGYDLTSISAEPASARTVALQKHFDQALLGTPQKSMGMVVNSLQYFDDVKGMCALILFASSSDDMGKLAQHEAQAFSRFSSERDSKISNRAESANPRNEPRTRVVYGVPQEPALMAAICSEAVRVLGTESIEDAAQALAPLANIISERNGKNRWGIGKDFRLSERLNHALQLALAPTSKFNRAIGAQSLSTGQAGYTFEPRHVPQLIWKEDYDKHLAKFFPNTKANFARRFCAMSLVKLCGYTWAQTAELLALPVDSSVKMANKCVGLIANEADKKKFSKALHDIAKRLTVDNERMDYAARRERLRNFTSIPRTRWTSLCEESGTTVGIKGGRVKYAAAWVWADVTGGDWILAPGLQDGNITNLREVYRQLEKNLFPQMEASLRRYGTVELMKE